MEYLSTPLEYVLVVSTVVLVLYVGVLLCDLYRVSVNRTWLNREVPPSAGLGIAIGCMFFLAGILMGTTEVTRDHNVCLWALLIYGFIHYGFAFAALVFARRVHESHRDLQRECEATLRS